MEQAASTGEARRLISISDLFRRAWEDYGKRFRILVGVVIVPFVIMGIGQYLVTRGFFLVGILLFAVGAIGMILSIAIAMTMIAKDVPPRAAWRDGLRIVFPLFWVGLLTYAAVLGGIVMLIVPGLIIGTWLLFGTYIVIIEDRRDMSALAQSREYARGYGWAIFGRYVLSVVIVGIAGGVFSGLASPLFAGAGGIVPLLFEALALPFVLIFIHLLYRDLAGIKPELASAAAPGRRGFLLTSIILGIVGFFAIPAIIAFLVFRIFLSGPQGSVVWRILRSSSSSVSTQQLTAELSADLGDQGLWQGQGTPLAAPTGTLGSFSVVLPPHYEIDSFIAGEAIVKSSESLTPYLIVVPGAGSFTDILARVRTMAERLGSGGSVIESTTTFAGYPAYSEMVGVPAAYRILVLQAGTTTLLMDLRYSTAPDPALQDLENQVIERIAASLRSYSATRME